MAKKIHAIWFKARPASVGGRWLPRPKTWQGWTISLIGSGVGGVCFFVSTATGPENHWLILVSFVLFGWMVWMMWRHVG